MMINYHGQLRSIMSFRSTISSYPCISTCSEWLGIKAGFQLELKNTRPLQNTLLVFMIATITMIVVITPGNVERFLWLPVSTWLSWLLQNKRIHKRTWIKLQCTVHSDIHVCFIITINLFSGKWFLYNRNDWYDLHSWWRVVCDCNSHHNLGNSSTLLELPW